MDENNRESEKKNKKGKEEKKGYSQKRIGINEENIKGKQSPKKDGQYQKGKGVFSFFNVFFSFSDGRMGGDGVFLASDNNAQRLSFIGFCH